MKKSFLFFVLLLSYPSYCNVLSANFLKEQYQDIVINNTIFSHGIRDCELRYQAIKNVLNNYKRPITVLDIGASQGFFSFKIAHNYNATCVMIEGGYNNDWKTSKQLLELCKRNNILHNIILLEKRITPEELERLGSCEHFDIVLALNVIHHFGDKWQRATEAILKLGDTIIIESPSGKDRISRQNKYIASLEEYLDNQHGHIILEAPRHTDPNAKGKLYWFEKNKTALTRPYWILKERDCYKGCYSIESNYLEKFFIKKDGLRKSCWKKGINLLTFLMLNGTYPIREKLLNSLPQLINNDVKDFMPWNIIIQGDTFELIDQDDASKKQLDKSASITFTMNMLKQQTTDNLITWFKNNYIQFLHNQQLKFWGWEFYEL